MRTETPRAIFLWRLAYGDLVITRGLFTRVKARTSLLGLKPYIIVRTSS